MLVVFLWIYVGIAVLGIVANIALIGQPRKPMTSGVAAINTLISSVFVVVLVLAALALS
jgi:hypothetical protein